jgi:hypothetical protein
MFMQVEIVDLSREDTVEEQFCGRARQEYAQVRTNV